MTGLTEAQREQAERYYPFAKQFARRAAWRVSGTRDPGLEQDMLSAFHEAVCEAVLEYDPARGGLFFVVRRRLIDAYRREEIRAKRRGLTGYNGGPRRLRPPPEFADDAAAADALAEACKGHPQDLDRLDAFESLVKPARYELSDRDREIVRLVYFEGLDGPGVGALCGESLAVVSKAVRRAVGLLKRAHGGRP